MYWKVPGMRRVTVCYDIAHDRRRDRLVTVLLNYAKRVQESVIRRRLQRVQ